MKRIPFFGEEYSAMNIAVVASLRRDLSKQSTSSSIKLAINYRRTPFTIREDEGVLYVFKKNTFGGFQYVTWNDIRWYYTIPGVIMQPADTEFISDYGLFSINTADCSTALYGDSLEYDLMGNELKPINALIDDPSIDEDNLRLYHLLNKELSLLELDSSPNKVHTYNGVKFSLKYFNRLRVVTSKHFNEVLEREHLLPLLGKLGKLLTERDDLFMTDSGLFIASYAEISNDLFPELNKVAVLSVPKLLRYFTTLLIDHQIIVIDPNADSNKDKQTNSDTVMKNKIFLSRAALLRMSEGSGESAEAMTKVLGSDNNFTMFSKIVETEINTIGHGQTEVGYNRMLLDKLGIIIG